MSHTFDTPTKKVFCFQLPTAWTFHICVVEMSQCLCLLCKNKWNKKHIQKKKKYFNPYKYPLWKHRYPNYISMFKKGHTFSKPSILGIYIKTSGVPIPSPETPKALGLWRCQGSARHHQATPTTAPGPSARISDGKWLEKGWCKKNDLTTSSI